MVEGTARSRGRILVIDDDQDLIDIVSEHLRESFEVVGTTDVRTAMERLAKGANFDAILCDLAMPRTTGVDLHNFILERCPENVRRLIFVSGLDRRWLVAKHPQIEAIWFLSKPFGIEELEAIVAEVAGARLVEGPPK